MTLSEKQAVMKVRVFRSRHKKRVTEIRPICTDHSGQLLLEFEGGKVCRGCQVRKPLRYFGLKSDRPGFPDRRHSYCNGCKQRRHKKTRIQWVREYWTAHPCVDCGETDFDVLEFDHRDPTEKACEVPRATSQAAMEAEAAKCDIRCANCHRRRHARERRAKCNT